MASSPWRLARATSSPAVFCSRLSPSTSRNHPPPLRLERGELLELGASDRGRALRRPLRGPSSMLSRTKAGSSMHFGCHDIP